MTATIIILAGPNGAGKTTFARSFLPQEANCLRFINADLIAAGLSPFAPEVAALTAGRLMLGEIESCVKRRESFAIETTLSGIGYVARIRQWRSMGYEVSLYFLTLPSPEMAIRLAKAFDTSPESWLTQQVQYDLWEAEQHSKKLKVRKLNAA